ncbi:hypothetical protein OIV83_005871 [Microbotryomycetes sp. JL201]|nr:hypothetical protein OIV83_005871 [Microbotryomycetes sp. JL201]
MANLCPGGLSASQDGAQSLQSTVSAPPESHQNHLRPLITATSSVKLVETPPTPVQGTPRPSHAGPGSVMPMDPSRPNRIAQHAGHHELRLEQTGGIESSQVSTESEAAQKRGRRNSFTFVIPPQLVKPGIEMLKVSAKSARRARPRKMWLEIGGDLPDDGELGLEVGIGLVGGQDVRLCWEKGGFGIGGKKQASVPLSRLKDLRFGSQGSFYRTALQISRDVQPRWMTLVYSLPPQRSVLNNASNYKLVHFIAPNVQAAQLWKNALEGFKEGRLAKPSCANADESTSWKPVDEAKVVTEQEVHQLCMRLGVGMGKNEISAAFKQTAAPNDFLDFEAFQKFVKLLKRRDEVEEVYRGLVGAAGVFDEKSWKTFLKERQSIHQSEEALTKSFIKYADRHTRTITLDGFSSFLMSSDNAALRDDSGQDMDRPIVEYYISSSHNTYLVGNQFQGESTVEGYIRALEQGCRSVELDVWDGDDGEPVVTHGLTFTSKIPVRTILEAIREYSFLSSPYPVILSMEVHCGLTQQDRLAEIMRVTLGDTLVSKRLDDMDGEIEKLPSPNDLKGRILLKAKNKLVTTSNANGFPLAVVPDESSSADSSASSDSDIRKVFRAVRENIRRPSLSRRSSSGSLASHRSSFSGSSPASASVFTTQGNRLTAQLSTSPPPMSPAFPTPPPPPPKSDVMSSALLSLLVYTVGVKARGFNKKENYAPTHVISVGESALTKMIRDEGARQDFVAHNRGHLTRAYPRGRRLASSNYTPHHMWAAGVQLVALNWQTFDVGMELNTAMFSRTGRSGYVLKPELLRKKGIEKDKTALVRSEKFVLELEILSAQQLPRPRDSSSASEAEMIGVDPFVEVSLYQPGVVQPVKRRTKVVSGNSFNPIFKFATRIEFSCHPAEGMLDLVFVRLEVLNAKGNFKAAKEEGKGDFLGAYAIPVGALLPGYRHVPLYDAYGDQHLFSTVFINSRVMSCNRLMAVCRSSVHQRRLQQVSSTLSSLQTSVAVLRTFASSTKLFAPAEGEGVGEKRPAASHEGDGPIKKRIDYAKNMATEAKETLQRAAGKQPECLRVYTYAATKSMKDVGLTSNVASACSNPSFETFIRPVNAAKDGQVYKGMDGTVGKVEKLGAFIPDGIPAEERQKGKAAGGTKRNH